MSESSASDDFLLAKFREFCIRQFAIDLREGDAWVASADAAALGRLAHSLKSVLSTLGEARASALAQRLERELADGEWRASLADWHALAAELRRLTAAPPPPLRSG